MLLLVAGFVVLMQTFAWITRLLERRAEAVLAPEDIGEAEEEEPPPSLGAVLLGANYGLILGGLACLLFWLWPPLMLVLSTAGIGFSGRTLVQGWRQYHLLVYRALAGMILSLASVGLHFLKLTGQIPALW